nr:hypothetical protein Iba_chr09aCG0250 [Ipomoea batatas]GME16983.1 hypothetical protein Iba_scaffold18202CG0090 [Ipomoea batatas]
MQNGVKSSELFESASSGPTISKLVAKDLKIPNIDPRLSSKFFHWAELAMIYPNSFRIMVKTDNRIMLAWENFKVLSPLKRVFTSSSPITRICRLNIEHNSFELKARESLTELQRLLRC